MSVSQVYTEDEQIDFILKRLDKPIALIGMMGVGKTKLGRMLSKALTLPFVDSDEEIETAAGMSIADIFERFGEPYFRDGEARVIRRLLNEDKKVIATGGGVITNSESADLIFEKSIVIWVYADKDIMLERTGRQDNRPLLKQDEPEKVIDRLIKERYSVYERAPIHVKSHNGPAASILHQMIDSIESTLR